MKYDMSIQWNSIQSKTEGNPVTYYNLDEY